MNYNEAMKYLDNTARFGMELGLDRTREILKFLGDPQEKIKLVHIAGTNGKGSTTAMISNILIEAGYKVGMYTSPYIEEFEERIQINNNNITKDDLAKMISEVSEAVEHVKKQGFSDPTYFEIVTCAGLLYFERKKVDIGVIEVGLGGRLDSTNVINPILSIITSISYDHTRILGDTLEEIAYEKAGIIKENIPLVLYPVQEKCIKVIEKVCSEKNSRMIKVNKKDGELIEIYKTSEEGIPYQYIKVSASENYDVKLSLLGEHQILNCAVVINAVEELINQGIKIDNNHIIKGLMKVKWPGRLETLSVIPKVVIDGAHNVGAIEYLSKNISTYFEYENLTLILGILSDKNVEDMVKAIVPLASRVIAVTPHSERGEKAGELLEIISRYNSNCETIEDYNEAFNKSLSYSNSKDMILATGSFYMIGDMRKIIRKTL